jgi:glycosyltransferase involved in cell wall biosynthesis
MRLLVPLPFDISNQAHGRNLRIAHLLQALQTSCEILCLTPDECTAIAARDVMPGVTVQSANQASEPNGEPGVFRNEPYLVRRSLSFLGCDANLARAIHRLAPSADVVAGFDMPSVAYLLAAVIARESDARPRIVCDLIDDPWLLRKSATRRYRWSPAGLKATAAMQVIRRRVLPRFDALVAVAPQDAASLAGVSGRPAAIVPNGAEIDAKALGNWPREPLVVFTGSMSFPANVAAASFMAREVWPLVLASRCCGLGQPDAAATAPQVPTLAIVGADPTPAVQALAEMPNVVVTGRVPSIRDWLARAQAAVAPMLTGTGIKNKILEACAAGCPVVATSAAMGGLPSGEDAGIIVADAPEQIAAQVIRLLADGTTARRIGSAGQGMARTRFSWTSVAAAFLEVLQGGIASPAFVPNSTPEADSDGPDAGGPGSMLAGTPEPRTAENKEALAHAAP